MGALVIFATATLFNAKFALPHERGIFCALFNTMNHVGFASLLSVTHVHDEEFARQLGGAVGITVSTVAFSTASSKGEDMLPPYHAAQWTSFAFGIIAIALAIIYFRGVGLLGLCTPPRASISKVERGESLDERIPSPENVQNT